MTLNRHAGHYGSVSSNPPGEGMAVSGTGVEAQAPVPAAAAAAVPSTNWRDHAESPWPWRADGTPNQAGGQPAPQAGEAGGFFVRCDALGGCRAYLKPMRIGHSPAHARAAREKIVSDVAHDLGILVPPVLLTERTSCPAGQERFVCVSRVMYPRQFPWHQIKRFVVDHNLDPRVNQILMAAMPRAAAGGMALDAWVSQPDHNDHPHNIIFGYTPSATSTGEFIFLDFAWSLGYPVRPSDPACPNSWEKGLWKNTVEPPFPPHMKRYIDPVVLDELVTKIEAFPEAALDKIVNRIPDEYLDPAQRALILEGLIGRRTLLRPMLTTYLKKGTIT